MSKEGERHAAELSRLEQRKKDLEDALGRLARDEAEAKEVAELAQEVQQLEDQVNAARAAAQQETGMTKTIDVRKDAGRNRAEAERQLDALAKGMQRDGETFEAAYDRALDTDMGRALMRTRDDAQELERGGVTSMHVEDAPCPRLAGFPIRDIVAGWKISRETWGRSSARRSQKSWPNCTASGSNPRSSRSAPPSTDCACASAGSTEVPVGWQ